MRKLTKRSAVIAGVAVVVIGGGAAAWAVNGWSIGGSGTAEANASTITPLTATSEFNEALFPGLKTSMLTKITNSNDFAVKLVNSVSVAASGVVVTPDDANATTCKGGLLAPGVLTTDFPGTPTVTAKTTNQGVNSTVTVGELPQACAGKHISITYSFTGQSQPKP